MSHDEKMNIKMSLVHTEFVVSGTVQGVSFRKYTQAQAKAI